jgi:LCP family protein required for cell wall assembly
MNVAHMFWVVSITLLILVPLGGIIWFTTVLVRAHQDVSAMIVPTPEPVLTSPMQAVAHEQATPLPVPTLPPTAAHALTLLTPLEPTLVVTDTRPPDGENADVWVGQAPPLEPWNSDGTRPHVTPVSTRLPDIIPSPWPTIQSLLPTPPPTPILLAAPPPAQQSGNDTGGTTRTEPPPAGDAITVLLLGNDRRPGETGVPRTDTLMLLRADPHSQRIALLSMPRDLWVTVPGYGATRINAAYVWGEIYQAPGGGLELARQTVSNLFGIPVDYVIMVDFEGFINLINVLGGITVEVEKELYDASFPTMNYGYTVAHFLPGSQQMDGETALTYSRIRHPDSDFMRNLRQQAVIMGIANRVRERGDLTTIMTVDTITRALRGYVQTTMPEERIVGLVWALRHVQEVERYAITSDQVLWGSSNDPYALVAPQAVLEELAAKFHHMQPASP